MRYTDRYAAGTILADDLQRLGPPAPVLILALPRGGVPVAAPIADRLDVALELILVRKITAPGYDELAIGAIAIIGDRCRIVRNDDIMERLAISPRSFAVAEAREETEVRKRMARLDRPTPAVEGATVILVDDGLATGATMSAAIAAVEQGQPRSIIVAVPVGPRGAVQALAAIVDRVICPSTPNPFVAVGLAYQDFHQLTDEEIVGLLDERTHRTHQ